MTGIARRDATAKLAAAAVLTAALLVTLDPVTSLVAIGLELTIAPFAGLGYVTLLKRGWPLLLSALGIVVFTALLSALPLAAAVTDATRYALRLVAVALPGVLAFATIEPTDLADSLVAHLRVPARFALGALAAFRLVPLLTAEWRQLILARRARGVDAGWNPIARARLFASAMFALLVGAIRRGIRLATAMEARGFDSGTPRTVARPTHFGGADALLIAGAAAVATVALLAGYWA